MMFPKMQRAVIYQNLTSKIYVNGPQEPPSIFGFQSLHRTTDGNEVPLRLLTSDEVSLEAWHITSLRNNPIAPISKTGPLFIFFHGNGSNRTRPQKLLIYEQIFKAFPGAQILAPEYRGFAKSGGKPDQKGVLLDARAAWDYATKHLRVDSKHIVLLGQSLGAAVTTHLLKEISDEGVSPLATFLFCGFTNVPDVSVDYPKMKIVMPLVSAIQGLSNKIRPYLYDQWDAIEIVRSGLNGPILWLHGTDDRVIPYSHGKSLIRAALRMRNVPEDRVDVKYVLENKLKLKVWIGAQLGFIKIPDGGHDDMGNRPEIFRILKSFLSISGSCSFP